MINDEFGFLSSQLTLQCAIECIAAHSKKGVLLLVDELMKSKTTVHSVETNWCLPGQINPITVQHSHHNSQYGSN